MPKGPNSKKATAKTMMKKAKTPRVKKPKGPKIPKGVQKISPKATMGMRER